MTTRHCGAPVWLAYPQPSQKKKMTTRYRHQYLTTCLLYQLRRRWREILDFAGAVGPHGYVYSSHRFRGRVADARAKLVLFKTD